MVKEAKLNVSGIMCKNCVNKIKTAVGSIEGVRDVTISDHYEVTTIAFSDDITKVEAITSCIESIDGKKFSVDKIELI